MDNSRLQMSPVNGAVDLKYLMMTCSFSTFLGKPLVCPAGLKNALSVKLKSKITAGEAAISKRIT